MVCPPMPTPGYAPTTHPALPPSLMLYFPNGLSPCLPLVMPPTTHHALPPSLMLYFPNGLSPCLPLVMPLLLTLHSHHPWCCISPMVCPPCLPLVMSLLLTLHSHHPWCCISPMVCPHAYLWLCPYYSPCTPTILDAVFPQWSVPPCLPLVMPLLLTLHSHHPWCCISPKVCPPCLPLVMPLLLTLHSHHPWCCISPMVCPPMPTSGYAPTTQPALPPSLMLYSPNGLSPMPTSGYAPTTHPALPPSLMLYFPKGLSRSSWSRKMFVIGIWYLVTTKKKKKKKKKHLKLKNIHCRQNDDNDLTIHIKNETKVHKLSDRYGISPYFSYHILWQKKKKEIAIITISLYQ